MIGEYTLMHCNYAIGAFRLNDREETEQFIVVKSQLARLPLSLHKIVNFGGYIDSETNRIIKFNEEGCGEFDIWFNNRAIPIYRIGKSEYIPDGYTRLTWMLYNHAYSLTDSYWVKPINNGLNRKKLVSDNKDALDLVTVAERTTNGTKYNGVNSTLGGNLEKYWCKQVDNGCETIELVKKTSPMHDILNIREVFASEIYHRQEFNNYCSYKYVRNSQDEIVGCKCKIFTSEGRELITAYDILAEHGETQVDKQYETIAQRAVEHGLNKSNVEFQLSLQILVDYLITNRDRHQNNFGFIRDANTLKLISMAPIYDSGSSISLEGERPEGVKTTTVNSIYPTELECLQYADTRVIQLDKLPSKEWLARELNKSKGLSEYRKEALVSLYDFKIKFLVEKKRER